MINSATLLEEIDDLPTVAVNVLRTRNVLTVGQLRFAVLAGILNVRLLTGLGPKSIKALESLLGSCASEDELDVRARIIEEVWDANTIAQYPEQAAALFNEVRHLLLESAMALRDMKKQLENYRKTVG